MTPTPDEEPQSRPLAVFKAPKAAANDTTALADVVFGEPASQGGETDAEPAAASSGEPSSGVHSEDTRHAESPAENPHSPQEYPQGYPQASAGSPHKSPQENSQEQASYPQAAPGYPQAGGSSPQVSPAAPGPNTGSYPQGSESAAPAGSPPAEETSPKRRRIQDIEFPQPEPENPFAEAEARVLEQIRARQRAQAMAAEAQVGPSEPQTSRLRPRMADEAPPPSATRSKNRNSKPSNPFAETEAATRTLDEARRTAAEQARQERARVEAAGQVSASPASGAPVSAQPISPAPVSAPPPVSAQPMSPAPMSVPPVSAQPMSPAPPSVEPPTGSHPVVPTSLPPGPQQPVNPPPRPQRPVNPPPGPQRPVNPPPGPQRPVNPPPGPQRPVNPTTGSQPVVPPAPQPPTGQQRAVPPPPNPYVEPRSGQHQTVDARLSSRPAQPVSPAPVNPPTGQHARVNPPTGQHAAVNPPTGQHAAVNPPTGQRPAVNPATGQHARVNPPTGQHAAVNPPTGQHQAVDPRLSARTGPPQQAPAPADPRHQQLVPMARPESGSQSEIKPTRLPKPPKQKDRSSAQELAITEIAGHTTFTPTAVTAWYRLPEVRWAFRPDAEREALISAIAEQYAGMAGYRLHLRRTTRPFPADQWARTVDSNTPRPLPPVQGAPTWGDHLVNAQHHLHNVQHAEGETYLGISFARRTLTDTLGEKFGRVFNRGTKRSERSRVERATEQFDEVLSAFGVRARRATSHELEWLIFRSVALGMDPPQLLSGVRDGLWEPGDVLALTEQIERYRTPYGSTVKLVNRLTGEERHVAVLTVGRMEDLDIPERHEPWLHFHERAPWPMELSSRLDILGPGEAFRNLEHRLRMIRSQQHDYDEHAMDAPPELERLAQRALNVGDEMTTGLATDAARVHGWHRIAVSADDRDECLERARKLIQMYNRELRLSLQHPKNQDWLAREFIPGEPVANTGYLRRMPVRLFAAALPQAASTVGDQRGDLIGRTSGTCRRPVFLDLHFPMEVRERSGLAVFVAEPGGGKSTLMGSLGYLAARRGVQVTLLDPSGPLARLCDMPEMKPYAKVINLTGSQPGTLAPYALIPTPKREHWEVGPEGDREYNIALSNARAERRMLVQDICSMLIPPQVAREATTARLLRHAARQVPAEETSTLEDVVDCLQDQDHDGSELAALLLDAAEMPLAMLFFGSPPAEMLTDDAMLTVITMAGLRLPDLKIEREYWSAEEALALPMLHTAHRLAVRRCYGGDINRRKLVGLDEAHFMEGWRSGRSFLIRMARDSRKWNLAALVASQNPTDILGLDVQNLVSTVFVGRIAEDPEIAAEALRMLRVPRDVGYEQTLAGLSEADTAGSQRLSYREFIMRDVDGRVQRMRADISYVPRLLEYLDTTPGGREAAERPANAPTAPGTASQRTGPAGSQMGSG